MESLRAINTIQQTIELDMAGLVEEHGDAVYRFCRSLTYSKEDAEDLFQETFLRALEHPGRITASDNPRGFLLSTSLYLWKSWKRRYARRKRLAPMEPLDESVESGVSLEDSYMEQEENRLVRRLVEELPEKFKIPTILYYTLELKIPEIAQTMRLPAGTIKSRLYQARKLVEKGLVAIQYEK